MPAPQPAVYNPNSLWRNGSRAFFKDQRAHQVGDILTVKVKITDKAHVRKRDLTQPQSTRRTPASTISSAARPSPIRRRRSCPAASSPPTQPRSSEGKGSIDRKEELLTNVAAVVTQVLPNGNLVIEGKQEIRVNYEIRELIVAGIVRPEDIESDNTIDFNQDRGSPHRLWRPRSDHRRAAAALRPAGAGRAAAVLIGNRGPTSVIKMEVLTPHLIR